MRKVPYNPPASRNPPRLAAATRRIRKIESGMRGSFSRASHHRKNARSRPETTSKPIVRNVPHPTCGASEIA